MMLGSRSWYAQLNGKIYVFQSKHQRDISGGEPINAEEAYQYHPHINVMFNDFSKWYAKHHPLNPIPPNRR